MSSTSRDKEHDDSRMNSHESVPENKFERLEESIELLVENSRQLGIIVGEFQDQSCQSVLNNKINAIISGLSTIDKCRPSVQDINVPLQVFDYIDEGKNPQLYTRDCLQRALKDNEQVKGKVETLSKFRSSLIAELSTAFPDQMAEYVRLRDGVSDN